MQSLESLTAELRWKPRLAALQREISRLNDLAKSTDNVDTRREIVSQKEAHQRVVRKIVKYLTKMNPLYNASKIAKKFAEESRGRKSKKPSHYESPRFVSVTTVRTVRG